MQVRHITEWKFEVDSEKQEGVSYLVDLAAEKDQICDCNDYYCRCAPKLKAKGTVEDYHCKHITAVAEWLFFNNILTEAQK